MKRRLVCDGVCKNVNDSMCLCGYHIKRNCFSAIVFTLKIKTIPPAVDDYVYSTGDVNDYNDDIDKGN